jgi:hypothetical protein
MLHPIEGDALQLFEYHSIPDQCFPSTFQRAKSHTDSDLENKLGGEVVQASHLRLLGNDPTVMAHGIVNMDEKSSRQISAPNSPLLIHKVR